MEHENITMLDEPYGINETSEDNDLDGDLTGSESDSEIMQENEENIRKTRRLAQLKQSARKHGLLKTESDTEPSGTRGMLATGKKTIEKNVNEEKTETLPEVLKPSLIEFEEAMQTSANLLKSSAHHLHDLMKSLTPKIEPDPVRVASADQAQTACIVARQMLDILKEYRSTAVAYQKHRLKNVELPDVNRTDS